MQLLIYYQKLKMLNANLFLSEDTPWLTISCSTISKRLSINLGCIFPVSKRVK